MSIAKKTALLTMGIRFCFFCCGAIDPWIYSISFSVCELENL